MKIRALVGFSGAICMRVGQEMDCSNDAVVRDLLACGYAEPVNDDSEDAEMMDESSDYVETERDPVE